MTKQDWIALGGPSPLAKWGFELMHSIVELCASQRQIHTIGRDDHVTLDPAHQTKSLWLAQFGLTAVYSVGLAFALPWAWAHPFGPLTKNVAVLVTLLYLAMNESKRGR